MLDKLSAGSPGPVGRDFPVAVVNTHRLASALGVAFQLNRKARVEGDLPGQGGHHPIAVWRKLSALGFENRPARSVEDANTKSLRRQVQLHRLLILRLREVL